MYLEAGLRVIHYCCSLQVYFIIVKQQVTEVESLKEICNTGSWKSEMEKVVKTTYLSTQEQCCWTGLKSYEENPGHFSEAAEATWLSS